MDTEYIIARARQEIELRRTAEFEQQWGGIKRPIMFALASGPVFAFFAAPGALTQKLVWVMGGVCNLRPSHSFFSGGVRLPLEARMIGIYGGFMLSFLLLLGMQRATARQLGTPVVKTIFWC